MQRIYPLLFVFLWSTGFVGARYGLPYAEPLSFLLTRYTAVVLLMLALSVLLRAPWPDKPMQWLHLGISGLLVQAVYLGGVFLAIKAGLPAGITALVVGMQPLLTAALSGWLLGEAASRRQWLGLALGFCGVTLVLSARVSLPTTESGLLPALLPAVVALLGITAGTLYQKRFCPRFDLRTGSVIQFAASALLTAAVVATGDGYQVTWTPAFLFALGWLVLVLSIGAISLLNLLIRSGSAIHVASLFYLTPPTTALLAWAMFGESLAPQAALGMALAVGGVSLAARPAPASR